MQWSTNVSVKHTTRGFAAAYTPIYATRGSNDESKEDQQAIGMSWDPDGVNQWHIRRGERACHCHPAKVITQDTDRGPSDGSSHLHCGNDDSTLILSKSDGCCKGTWRRISLLRQSMGDGSQYPRSILSQYSPEWRRSYKPPVTRHDIVSTSLCQEP